MSLHLVSLHLQFVNDSPKHFLHVSHSTQETLVLQLSLRKKTIWSGFQSQRANIMLKIHKISHFQILQHSLLRVNGHLKPTSISKT